MKKNRRLILLLTSALTLFASAADAAESPVDIAHAFLEQRSRHLGNKVQIKVAAPSAHWPHCTAPEAFLPSKNQADWGRITVGIRCSSGSTRYLQAQVAVLGNYWVPRENIPAGTTITEELLRREKGEISALPSGTLLKRKEMLGLESRRPLRAGTPVQQYQLQQRALVKRRQTVTLVAAGRGFNIQREGRALDEGAMGDKVRVRLPDRQIISGRVSGRGQIHVTTGRN